LAAQVVHFSGAQSTIGGGLAYPQGVAVDGKGNVYIADSFNNRVLKETFSAGNYAQSTVPAIGLTDPWGVAVDGSGNVYIGDTGCNCVYKVTAAGTQSTLPGSRLNGSGAIAADAAGNIYIADPLNGRVVKETLGTGGGYTESKIGSSLATPFGVAVDAVGNVYIADSGNNRVLKETPSGTSYTQTTVQTSGLGGPHGVAVDASGNIYVADTSNYRVVKETLSLGSYTQSTIASSGLYFPAGIAVDAEGNVYIADTDNNRVLRETLSGGDFGTVDVASTSPALALIFTFDEAGTLGNIAGLTQGAAGLDFADVGSGSCAAGTDYAAGASCAVNLTFTPELAGSRYGVAILQDVYGSLLATGYVHGRGAGPQVSFLPGTQITVPTGGVGIPAGVAVDGNGSIYIADLDNAVVLKETPTLGSFAQSTIGSGLAGPGGVAVDGGGNVYIADTFNDRVLKETLTAGSYTQSIVPTSSLSVPIGVAVDGGGNLYIADTGHSRVLKETLTAGSYVESTVLSGILNQPYGVAVDGSGNVHIADTMNNRVIKVAWTGSGYGTVSTVTSAVSSPQGLAVDGNGNVYVGDTDNNRVVRLRWTGSAYVSASTVGSGLFFPRGVAVDGLGNVYIADTSNFRLLADDFADPPSLTFLPTVWGSTNNASPLVVTVENMGNATLKFPVPSSGNNPSIATNFALNSSVVSSCPLVSAGSATAGTLNAGASCLLPISFAPTTLGTISGSLVLTDNALNTASPAYARQIIQLKGTVTANGPTILSLSPNSATTGSAAFTMTITGANFASKAVVKWGTTALTTTYVTTAKLLAAVPASLIAATGTSSVTVTSDGTVSNAATFTIHPAPPTITSLSPDTAIAGGAGFTLTINGTYFTSSATASWGSTTLVTTYVSANKLTAAVPASLIATAGQASVTVKTIGGITAGTTFTIIQPMATITSLSPNTAATGSGAFVLTVKGTNILPGAIVHWNNLALTSIWVSPSEIAAVVLPAQIATAGTASVTVSTSAGTSNAETFTITSPPPTITSLSPDTASAGGAAFLMIIEGSSFTANATVSWGGTTLATIFVSSDELAATVPASLIATAGKASVTVKTAGGTSAAFTFTIQ
jgi:sugar lactone lactonase YvrE